MITAGPPQDRDPALGVTVLGMMSGTSIDGIDLAAVRFRRDVSDPRLLRARILHTDEHPWPVQDREALLDAIPPAACTAGELSDLHARVGVGFGRAARRACEELAAHGTSVDLIASHGQTLFHGAGADGAVTSTLQIGDPSRIHAATGVPVIHDLRAADVARGGQGAPLVPILDGLLVSGLATSAGPGRGRTALVNIGGIANTTVLDADGDLLAIGDTGPGNALLDVAVRAATGEPCDRDAALARTGTVDQALLNALRRDPFYGLPLPRSTGREHFTASYVAATAAAHDLALPPLPDLLATLVELTASTLADVLREQGARTVLLSGGGARNPLLVERLSALLPEARLGGTEELGVDADAKEAVLIALLGWLSCQGLPGVPQRGELPATGARTAAVLGSLTPPVGAPAPDGLGPVRALVLEHEPHAEAADGDLDGPATSDEVRSVRAVSPSPTPLDDEGVPR